MNNPEADVIAAIDALERDAIDDLVDWQMTDSPAAVAEHGGNPRWALSRGSWLQSDAETLYADLPDDPLDLSEWFPIISRWDRSTLERLQEPARERIVTTFGDPHRAPGGASGRASDLFAITPDGERIEPDAAGVLHFQPEDQVFMLGPGGYAGAACALASRGGSGGGRHIDAALAAALAWNARSVPPTQFPIGVGVMGGTATYARVDDATAAALAELASTPVEGLYAAADGLGTLSGTVDNSDRDENVT